MRALVTGATGFIGRYLVRELLQQGYEVIAVVRPSSDVSTLDRRVAPLRATLQHSTTAMAPALESTDVVLHLLGGTRGSWRSMFDASVTATEHLVSALADADWGGRLVHVSTMAVYDDSRARSGVVDEDTPREEDPSEMDDYTWTKGLQEQLIREFADSTGVALTVVRPGFVYGAERPFLHPLGRLMGSRLMVMKGGRDIMPLNYVENTASLLAACARHPEAPGQTFNAVDPEPVTQLRYLWHWLRAQPRPPVVLPIPRTALRGVDAAYRLIDQRTAWNVRVPGLFQLEGPSVRYARSRAETLLGWRPPVPLQEALRRTLPGAHAV